MKNTLLFFVFVITFFTTNAQTIGIQLSPYSTTTESYNDPGSSYSIGGFVNKKLNDRFIFETGINYVQYNINDKSVSCLLCADCPCPNEVDYRVNYIELPSLFKYLLSEDDAKWQFHLTSGYSIGYITGENRISYFDKETVKNSTELDDRPRLLHIGNFGFDITHNFNNKIHFAIGSNYRFTNIDESYGSINNFSLNIKTGINLK